MKQLVPSRRQLALVLLLASACDHGIGRALVGKLKPEPDGPPLACGQPAPSCSFDAGVFSALDATVSGETDAGELLLQTLQPRTVELAGAILSNTRITLEGPITLKITADAQLNDLTIVAAADSGASVQLADVTVAQLRVRMSEGSFRMQRGTLMNATVAAGRVELSSSSLTSVDVEADELWIADVGASQLSLRIGEGTIVGAQLDQVSLQRCGSLLLSNSRMTASSFAGCTDMLSVDRSAIGHSTFAGPVASQLNVWEAVTFAVGGSASLSSWEDTISNARFCAGTTQVVLGDPIGLNCNECTQLTAVTPQVFCVAHEDSSAPSSTGSPTDMNPECAFLDRPLMCSSAETNKNPY